MARLSIIITKKRWIVWLRETSQALGAESAWFGSAHFAVIAIIDYLHYSQTHLPFGQKLKGRWVWLRRDQSKKMSTLQNFCIKFLKHEIKTPVSV